MHVRSRSRRQTTERQVWGLGRPPKSAGRGAGGLHLNKAYWIIGLLDDWIIWIIGFLDFSSFGILGVLDYWTFGFLDYWIFGLLDYWIIGCLALLDYWIIGLLDLGNIRALDIRKGKREAAEGGTDDFEVVGPCTR